MTPSPPEARRPEDTIRTPVGAWVRYANELEAELRELQEACPLCGHAWRQHDPEDGKCDAHSAEEGVFGPCRCGRDVAFQQMRSAVLSHAALAASSEEPGERLRSDWPR